MYYEEAEVKEYYRKDSKGIKQPYWQIGIKKKSKFNKPKPIALIDIAEVKELESFLEANPIEEYKAKINKLEEDLSQYKQQLKTVKATNETLSSENNELKKDKIQLQEDLLTYKNHYEDKAEELTEEKEESKKLLASIVSLTNKNNELDKENTFLKSRGLKDRIFNKQYAKEPDVPEIVEAESKASEDMEH